MKKSAEEKTESAVGTVISPVCKFKKIKGPQDWFSKLENIMDTMGLEGIGPSTSPL